MTITFAPCLILLFILDANTGCASVGLAPITKITSVFSTDLNVWVPADVP